ncbi:hypothetical protein OGAPHI_005763 [Ogataea philodendri]|uniref:Secreted protein n=1 Tax=Ogataea philodendri TaxID=1378263 RepID=A0A9P8T2A3_9ASCO|nr:uncharacterized protein OGAPHI_005763 [Ogataea philodendri]KAH3662511.1 hypothetical protein OGAPHI_005763 [Ogataea philodendri]
MSSTLRSMLADSMAVLALCCLMTSGSQMPYSFMSTILPLSPSIPQVCSPIACLALSCDNTLIGLPPQFCTSVLGITSNASATAWYGHCCTPSIFLALSAKPTLTAISVAPPPGASDGSKNTFLVTAMASCRFLSISFKTSLDGPRNSTVHAPGSLHFTRNVKYSSPISFTSNRPHLVPTSDSFRSSTRFTMVAPVDLEILLLSLFFTLLNTEQPPLSK